VAELRFAGHGGAVTIGQLVSLYRLHRVPVVSESRQGTVRALLPLLERRFDRALVVDDLTPHHLDGYVQARRSGALVSPRPRTPLAGVRDGTIRNELHLLRAMIRWGRQHRVNGRALLATDPLDAVPIVREQNAMRPLPPRRAIRRCSWWPIARRPQAASGAC
jgi:hypothetical protein